MTFFSLLFFCTYPYLIFLEQKFILVDLTCELPRIVGEKDLYFCIPSWDGTGPSSKIFAESVTKIVQKQVIFSLFLDYDCLY